MSEEQLINYSVNANDFSQGEKKILMVHDNKVVEGNFDKYIKDMATYQHLTGANEEESDISAYDLRRTENELDMQLNKATNVFVTDLEKIRELGKSPQATRDKVLEINGIIEYYINSDVFLGKVYEILENNINTNYSVRYATQVPNKGKGKTKKTTTKDKEILDNAKKITEEFLDVIDINSFIVDSVLSTFSGGNYVGMLQGDANSSWRISKLPLDLSEVTPIQIGGSNVVSLDVRDIRDRLNEVYRNYNRLKSVGFMDVTKAIDEAMEEQFPPEVYEAYKVGDEKALLNPERTALVRINTRGYYYGLSPLFKALKPLLMLEQVDSSDSKVILSKSKKIYYQKTRKELLLNDSKGKFCKKETIHATGGLAQALANDVTVYTSAPYVEGLEIIEPSTELTPSQNVTQYKNDVVNGVGIGFTIANTETGVSTVRYNYEDLLKTINKIVKLQVQPIINKFIQVMIIDNGFDVSLAPKIEIQDTKFTDLDTMTKVVDLYYSKLGLSMETVIGALGLSYADELEKRERENGYKPTNPNSSGLEGVSQVFTPYGTSYNSSGTDTQIDSSKNGNGSAKSENQDKAIVDKNNNDNK